MKHTSAFIRWNKRMFHYQYETAMPQKREELTNLSLTHTHTHTHTIYRPVTSSLQTHVFTDTQNAECSRYRAMTSSIPNTHSYCIEQKNSVCVCVCVGVSVCHSISLYLSLILFIFFTKTELKTK